MPYGIYLHANPLGRYENRFVIDGGAPGVFNKDTYVKKITESKGARVLVGELIVSEKGQFLVVPFISFPRHAVEEPNVRGQLIITLSNAPNPFVVPIVYIEDAT